MLKKSIISCLVLSVVFQGNIAPAASDQVIGFSCGNVEFALNTQRSTISNRFIIDEPVSWQFDGEWIRWTIVRTNEAFGVNAKNGYFLNAGEASDSECRIDDPSILTQLPMSKGASIRKAFILLSKTERKEVQQNLADFGYYNSTVDGLWGGGTETAIMKYIEEGKSINLEDVDIETDVGAVSVILALQELIHEGDECDSCEPPEPSPISNSSTSPFIVTEVNQKPVASMTNENANSTEADRRKTLEPLMCGEALTIRGLCWEIPIEKMAERKSKEGFSCDGDLRDGYYCRFEKKHILMTPSNFNIFPDSVIYSCENFGTCSLNFREVSEKMVESGIVGEMNYEFTSYSQMYCGLGSLNDKVCVVDFTDFNSIAFTFVSLVGMTKNTVVLSKGGYSSNPITFD